MSSLISSSISTTAHSGWILEHLFSRHQEYAKNQNIKALASSIFKAVGLCDYDLSQRSIHKKKADFENNVVEFINQLRRKYLEDLLMIERGEYANVFKIGQHSILEAQSGLVFYEKGLKNFLRDHPLPSQVYRLLSLEGAFKDFGNRIEDLGKWSQAESLFLSLIYEFLDNPSKEPELFSENKKKFEDFLISKAALCHSNSEGFTTYTSWIQAILDWNLHSPSATDRIRKLFRFLNMDVGILKTMPVSQTHSSNVNNNRSNVEISFRDFLIEKSYQCLLKSLRLEALPNCLEIPIKKYFGENEVGRKLIMMGYGSIHRHSDGWKSIFLQNQIVYYIEQFLELCSFLNPNFPIECDISTSLIIFNQLLSFEHVSMIKDLIVHIPLQIELMNKGAQEALAEINEYLSHSKEFSKIVPEITCYAHCMIISEMISRDKKEEEAFLGRFMKGGWVFIDYSVKLQMLGSFKKFVEITKLLELLKDDKSPFHLYLELIIKNGHGAEVISQVEDFFYRYRFNRHSNRECGLGLLPSNDAEENGTALLALLNGTREALEDLAKKCLLIEKSGVLNNKGNNFIPLIFWADLLVDAGDEDFYEVVRKLVESFEGTNFSLVPLLTEAGNNKEEIEYIYFLFLEYLRDNFSFSHVRVLHYIYHRTGVNPLELDLNVLQENNISSSGSPTFNSLSLNSSTNKNSSSDEQKNSILSSNSELDEKESIMTPSQNNHSNNHLTVPIIQKRAHSSPRFIIEDDANIYCSQPNSTFSVTGEIQTPLTRSITEPQTPLNASESESQVEHYSNDSINISLNLSPVHYTSSNTIEVAYNQITGMDNIIHKLKIELSHFLDQIKEIWEQYDLTSEQMTVLFFSYFPNLPIQEKLNLIDERKVCKLIEEKTKLLEQHFSLLNTIQGLLKHSLKATFIFNWFMYAPEGDKAVGILDLIKQFCFGVEKNFYLLPNNTASNPVEGYYKEIKEWLPKRLLELKPEMVAELAVPYHKNFSHQILLFSEEFLMAKAPLSLKELSRSFLEDKHNKILLGGVSNTRDLILFNNKNSQGIASFNDWIIPKDKKLSPTFVFSHINWTTLEAITWWLALPLSINRLEQKPSRITDLYKAIDSFGQVDSQSDSIITSPTQGKDMIKIKTFCETLYKQYCFGSAWITRSNADFDVSRNEKRLEIDLRNYCFFHFSGKPINASYQKMTASDYFTAGTKTMINSMIASIQGKKFAFEQKFMIPKEESKSESKNSPSHSSLTLQEVTLKFNPKKLNAITLYVGEVSQEVYYHHLIEAENFGNMLEWHLLWVLGKVKNRLPMDA
jgi:hypothetical protein